MKKITILFLTVFAVNVCKAQQVDINYFLPRGITYNSAIPTPANILGYEVGEWHASHDQLVNYMHLLANTSDRIQLREYGRTFESRPLLVLTITSPKNLKDIENIKSTHAKLCDPKVSKDLDVKKMPAVIYMGYSIHGNEASGSNAALLAAYYLAAAQGSQIDSLLENTIILLDPCFNPDGMQRFSTWVNSRKSYHINSDPNNMEQNEPWPGGRTNHYWFDLNRDWLQVQLPESKGRITVFQEWKPNVLTDHHEMGTNSTFFFQPGIPSRNNPLTPESTYDLTRRIGEYHAEALDKIGSLYYTQESFDDFYFGKGSTYPDIQGGVGILFEQASSRGHAQKSDNGVLTFPFTIRNQFTTTLSTLKAVNNMREELLNHQRNFFNTSIEQAQNADNKAYIFASKDKYRNYCLADLISTHDIRLYHPQRSIKINNTNYYPDEAYIIPLVQPQYRLIKTLFETDTTFQDSLFYDISTWTLPLAFGIDYDSVNGKSFRDDILGKPFNRDETPEGSIIRGDSATIYAYAFEWYFYNSPKVLYDLLDKGYKVKVATEPFYSINKRFERGSIMIPVSLQDGLKIGLSDYLAEIAKESGIDIYALNTGLDYKGASLGSPSFKNIDKPKAMILVGQGVSAYDAGEVWHLFDQRYNMDLSLVSLDDFNHVSLKEYNTMVMVSGRYLFNEGAREKLKEWVKNGGTLIASESATTYLSAIGLGRFQFLLASNDTSSVKRSYAAISDTRGAQKIGGAIFQAKVDTTHPLLYGYEKENVALFKNSELFLKPSNNPFGNPIIYTDFPLLSGYISPANLNKLKGGSALGVSHYGNGVVIGFTEDLNFRAFWYGTNKIFMNAVFFGQILNRNADY